MGCIFVQIFRQVDNENCIKRAFLDTNTAADAQLFGDVGKLRCRGHLNTQFTSFDDGTAFLAFLATLFGLASIGGDDGYTRQPIRHLFFTEITTST